MLEATDKPQRDPGSAKRQAVAASGVVPPLRSKDGPPPHGNPSRAVRVLRNDQRRVFFSGCYTLSAAEAKVTAKAFVDACSTHAELFKLIAAIAGQPAAIPLRLSGKTYKAETLPSDVKVADLGEVAALASRRLSREYAVAALRLGGKVQAAVLESIQMLPELSHLVGIRRPDLQWFWQSCQFKLRQTRTAAQTAAVTAAIESPWHFQANTVSFNDFKTAAARVEAQFATPGTDIVVCGTSAAAVSLRDKTLLLLMLLWWEDTNYAKTAPPCTPSPIADVVAHLQAEPCLV